MKEDMDRDLVEMEGRAPEGDGRESESPLDIFRRCHRLLRGRYPLAIALAILFGALGGAAGFLSQTPKYESVGQIHVRPMLDKILYETEMSEIMPMFRNYVSTQAELMRNPRVIDAAFQSEAWQALGRGSGPAARERFIEALDVGVEQRSGQIIRVRYLDPDPQAARIATREVIRAYTAIFGSGDQLDDPERLRLLQDRARHLRSEIARRQSRIRALAGDLGAAALRERHAARLEEIDRLEALRVELLASIEGARASARAEPDADAAPDAERIAQYDPQLAALLAEKRGLLVEIDRLRAMGIKEGHRDMIRRRRTLASVEERIRERVSEWEGGDPAGGAGPLPETLAGMEARLGVVERQIEAARADAAALADRIREVGELASQNETDQAELSLVSARLAEIELESKVKDLEGVTGRISVINDGTLSHSPGVDRRVPMALAGAVGLGSLPVGLLMLLGLLDGRYRYSDDARDATPAVPMLGVLPRLPARLDDPEQAAIAAHAVHQVRAIIQLWAERDGGSVVAITSPTSGDGKTSLSLALGLSLATSGARTLLVDFDLVGCGLSRSLRLTGERESILDALERGSLEGCVLETGTPRLSILPAGDADAREIGRISPAAAGALLRAGREAFDFVVVDTGPILGSLEACIAGAEADAVVLAVGRGQHRARVQQAMHQLSTIGARLIGVVFNQAEAGDFDRSVSGMSARSTRPDGLRSLVIPLNADDDRLAGYGPVARSVARGA